MNMPLSTRTCSPSDRWAHDAGYVGPRAMCTVRDNVHPEEHGGARSLPLTVQALPGRTALAPGQVRQVPAARRPATAGRAREDGRA